MRNAGAHVVVPDLDGYASGDSLHTWIRHGTAANGANSRSPLSGIGPVAASPKSTGFADLDGFDVIPSPRPTPRHGRRAAPSEDSPPDSAHGSGGTQRASPQASPIPSPPSGLAVPGPPPPQRKVSVCAPPTGDEDDELDDEFFAQQLAKRRASRRKSSCFVLRPLTFSGVLFDVDGVFANVRQISELAWRLTIDELLLQRQEKLQEPYFEFESEEFERFFYGMQRLDGLATFLASRQIKLQEGSPDDDPVQGSATPTIHALANKQRLQFIELLSQNHAQVQWFMSTILLVHDLRRKGLKVGVISTMEGAARLLEAKGVLDLCNCIVDGPEAQKADLAEFPAPDLWLRLAEQMELPLDELVVVGGSPGSLQAARQAKAAFVIGMLREGTDEGVEAYGADIVIRDFAESHTAEHIQRWWDAKFTGPRMAATRDRRQSLAIQRRGSIRELRPTGMFAVADWEVREDQYLERTHQLKETLFCLGNGFLAMRGSFEEGFHGAMGESVPGTYLNGFYESSPIRYAEAAYGYPERHQTMLNVTGCRSIRFSVPGIDGPVDVHHGNGEITDYQRTLSFQEGVVTREYTWTNGEQKSVQVKVRNLVSFEDKNLAVIEYEVTPDFEGEVFLTTTVEGQVTNVTGGNDPRVGAALTGPTLKVIKTELHEEGLLTAVTSRTTYSNLVLACAARCVLTTENAFLVEGKATETATETEFRIAAEKGVPIKLTKYCAYHHSRDVADLTALGPNALATANGAQSKGMEHWTARQAEYLKRFWEQCNVEIRGDPGLQQGLRFNMLHLLMSVGRDGRTNIGAKGLTGEGYEGHYFWDTEIYIFPFFLYTMPDIARGLLEFRYNTLDGARRRAKELDHKGALYPWRTIMGDEASAYFPAGTAQYHINADVIFSLKRYMEATEDTDFLREMGAEMVFETARFWVDIGNFRTRDGKFVINMVTGPDEYTALVNNNCFTNLMARNNLQYAVEVAQRLKKDFPKDWLRLSKALELTLEELEEWARAAQAMYLPYDEKLGIFLQDDSFLNKDRWDIPGTDKDKFPLLLHYHPLSIYRKQVCKQADLLLAEYLLGDLFSREQKARDYAFYEPLTTHDSSLSACVFAILAAELGQTERAYAHFIQTARMDLDNHHHNTQHGIHTAAMSGTWLSLTGGFAGMRTYNGKLTFNPWLPDEWDGYSFNIVFRGSTLNVEVSSGRTVYTLKEGKGLSFLHKDVLVSLSSPGDQVQKA